MKKYSIFAAALSLAAIVSCQKEISENQQTTITPEIELESITLCTGDSQSKTSVSGQNIVWNADDKIDIFSDANGYSNAYPLSTSENEVDGNAAKFSGEVAKGTTDFYAVYPSGSATGASKEGLINITVPTNQTPKENSFGEEMNISVAKGTKKLGDPQVKSVAFHNVCSYLKFTVPSYITNVNRVDVTCDNRCIAGSTTVNYTNLESGSDDITGPGKSNTVSMSVKSGSFAPGGTFWFVLTPGEVKKLTIKLYTEDGKNWTRTSSKQFTLNIGQPKNLGIIDFVPTLQASAEHTKDKDGYLTGTEVKVDLGLPDALRPNVSKVSLKVVSKDGKIVNDGPIVWEYTLDNISKNSFTISSDNWPYLPKGEYTVSGTYKTGERTVPFVSADFTSPAPEFSVNTPSAYTNYDTYKTSGANAANGQDGSTIYGISNNGVKISPEILSKYASLIGEGGGYSYTIDVNSATAGDNNNQTWGEHKVFAKFTFDKVTMPSSALTCYVTGLPFIDDKITRDYSGWTISNASINTGSIDINGAVLAKGCGYVMTPKIVTPSSIKVIVSLTAKSDQSFSSSTMKLYLGATSNNNSPSTTTDISFNKSSSTKSTNFSVDNAYISFRAGMIDGKKITISSLSIKYY